MSARRRLVAVLALVAAAIGLVPVFQSNVLGTSDPQFFTNWDRDSQALVLANIERQHEGAPPSPWALFVARPQLQSPYETFDGLSSGQRPTATSYTPYTSSLELQGRLFAGLYAAGCDSVTCLTTAESALFAGAFVAFLTLLALVTRRSLSLVVLACSLTSPWIVASAHNLYWVPWTWLLPAIAACAVVMARSPGARAAAIVAVGVGTGIKSGTGYEFLTTTTLLAASIPWLAQALGRRRPLRRVVSDTASIFIACVAAFVVVLVIHALVSGGGDPVAGARNIAFDAMKRTYGSPELGADIDALTVESLKVSPLAVIAIYIVGWTTNVFSLNLNASDTHLTLGPGTFFALLVAAVAITVVAAMTGRREWRRNAVLLVVGAAPAVSWWILGKSHAYTATPVCYVLWYLILIPILVWIIGAAVSESAHVRRLVAIASPSTGSPGARRRTAADDLPDQATRTRVRLSSRRLNQ